MRRTEVKGNWSDGTFEKYDQEELELRTKHAKTSSGVTADALEIIDDQKSINAYLDYINVFFAENKPQFEKAIRI